MKLGIVTDSTCDLPAALVEQHGLEVIPSILVLDGKEYIDGQTITRDEFYRRLPALRTPPTTAAPAMGEYSSRYESLLSHGCEHVISIHAAGKLTSIVDTARLAARDFEGRVTCVDSGSLSLGVGFQVLAAAEAAEMGLQAALAAIESAQKRLKVNAALDTMEYLRRSGRVPGAVAALGGLLSIKPLVDLTDGVVKAIAAVRTTHQANDRLLNFLLECGPLERLAVLHSGLESRAREFLNVLMQKASQSVPRDILLVNVTTVIGTHVGPHGLGFAAIKAG
ncbi:MAG: DegV family protein [Chloroflexi bacterium]|nr:DegV family protein [Chloroflexota bacterium]